MMKIEGLPVGNLLNNCSTLNSVEWSNAFKAIIFTPSVLPHLLLYR
jgi:hypothetical protein